LSETFKDVLTRLSKMTNHRVWKITPADWAKATLQIQWQAAS